MGIFSALAGYGSTEPENYLTESFALLLRTFLARSPARGLQILNRLVATLPLHPLMAAPDIRVETQVTTPAGRPDIRISEGNDTVIYIEIKHDSPLGAGQLEAYLGHLETLQAQNHRLVFLSRARDASLGTALADSEYHHICWYNLHAWISEAQDLDPVCVYLANDFLAFLEEKSMDVPRVKWEYEDGVHALMHLTQMMEVAFKEVLPKGRFRRTGGWHARGYYVDNAFFFGIRLAEPMVVVFENNFGTNPTDEAKLDLRTTHFLALSQGEQLETMLSFVREALANVPRGSATAEPAEPAA